MNSFLVSLLTFEVPTEVKLGRSAILYGLQLVRGAK
jgi:hypothetical protein